MRLLSAGALFLLILPSPFSVFKYGHSRFRANALRVSHGADSLVRRRLCARAPCAFRRVLKSRIPLSGDVQPRAHPQARGAHTLSPPPRQRSPPPAQGPLSALTG
eukprot:1614890-Pleurochrysis_carterae.AAC.1